LATRGAPVMPVCKGSQTVASQIFFAVAASNGNQATVSGSDIDFSIPDGHASIGARGIGAVQCLIEPDLGVVFPDDFPWWLRPA